MLPLPHHPLLFEGMMEFDEEQCRDYIVWELGEERKVPGFESYETGMQLIRRRLVKRYGDEKLEVAMAIVHDLIENTRNAQGYGDEGDIWAAWRYYHTKRTTDHFNPATPQFANRVLCPDPCSSSKETPVDDKENSFTKTPLDIVIAKHSPNADNALITNALSNDLHRDIVMYDTYDGTVTEAAAPKKVPVSKQPLMAKRQGQQETVRYFEGKEVVYKDAGQQTD